jgi:DNA ligase-associated metallophosphoesterase
MGKAIALQLEGEMLEFHPERALVWPAEHALLVADLHLGKAEAFQSNGIGVPNGHNEEDLIRLETLITDLGAKKVFILGDLFHARITDDLLVLFRDWSNSLQAEMHLISGNHDRYSEFQMRRFPITVHENELQLGPFRLSHEPRPEPRSFNICGHIHPQVRISGGNDTLRLPCFVVEKNQLILPSFGSFTGGFKVDFQQGRTFFAIAEGEVVEI